MPPIESLTALLRNARLPAVRAVTAQRRGCVLLLLLVELLCSAAGAEATFPGIPAPPQLNVNAYVLLDFDSGAVLAEHNSHERAEPASITKIMTSYLAAKAINAGTIALDDVTTVSEKAWRMEGSRMFIEVNKQVSVDELLQGVIIQSGNDASVALAEYVSGSEESFATSMNDVAAQLGMRDSSFANSTGLPDPNTYSTAHDLALMAAAFIRDFPDIYSRFAQKEYTYAGIRQHNRNRLLARDSSVDGFKTGHTEAAGFCLVSSARRGEMRLIAVVLGAESDSARTEASQALLNYGFRFFESRKIYDAGDTVTSRKIWKGQTDSIDLTVAAPLYIAIPRGKYDAVQASAEVSGQIEAPVEAGQTLGEVVLKFEDKIFAQTPLIAAESVESGSVFSRAIDDIRMRF